MEPQKGEGGDGEGPDFLDIQSCEALYVSTRLALSRLVLGALDDDTISDAT